MVVLTSLRPISFCNQFQRRGGLLPHQQHGGGVRQPPGRSARARACPRHHPGPRPRRRCGRDRRAAELTALPSIGEERWVPWVREADVLLVNGGDALYLCHWMRQSGLADLLPSLSETVWAGLSAGIMVMTPHIGEDFVQWKSPSGDDSTLGVVDFSIFPHLDHELLPENTMAEAERWAAGIPNRAYAIDDETAIKVIDGHVEVVSEGHWKLFTP
ncbi:Type 1 glutamine amidotransferase-like domain-containing protein [Microbispora camponoti]|uniref:Type 1 glutamine amidotransferase-like domain-containing protein n=1 Tax=Microbispora bryophytorum subsp. camponoti TaxID=1677852 RepID=A0ABR8LEU5_9ACTN|nr:Type 1 glutamine amidotransferase-like domain-containing protein [Microbispora camponoti]